MKLTPPLRSFLIACGPILAAGSIHAADVTWDITPGTVGVGDSAVTGGLGTWDTSNGNWTTDAGANNVAWVNGNNDTAIFGGTAGTVTLGSNVTVGGLQLNNGYSIAPGAVVDGGPYTLTFGTAGDINVSSGTSTISAEIAGSSTITKTGNGALQLNAVNSFTGDTVISAGTLRLGTNNNTGTLGPTTYDGNITIATGALLDMTNSNDQTFNGVISGGGNLQKRGGGTLILAGDNTYTGKTIIGGGGGGGRTLEVSSFNSVNSDGINPGIPSMTSSSLGAPTTVANGTIQLGDGGNVRSSTLRYTGSGETTDRVMNVQFNSSSKHTISNAGAGLLNFTSNFTITPSSGSATSGLTLRGSGNGQIAQMGTIPGILEKADAGTWAIGGTNGANSVTVTGGNLLVNGTMNVTTTVGVSSGATLGGSGTVGGAITVNNGGTLSPGNSAGQFNVANSLNLGGALATSNTFMELGGTSLGGSYDNITLDALATAMTYGGHLNVVNLGLYDMDASTFTYDLFSLNGLTPTDSFNSVTVNSISLSNSGGLWTGTNGDVSYAFDQALGDLSISAIPEPSAAALLGVLGTMFLLRRRR